MRHPKVLLFTLPVFALLCSPLVIGQIGAVSNGLPDSLIGKQGQSDDFKISTDVEMVLLDVSVQDRKGGYVTNLPQSAFQIEENGVPQPIKSFANVDVPVTVGLLMDDSGSMRTRRDDVNAAGLHFIEKSNPKDQVFVLNFNDTVRSGMPPLIPFSDNIDILREALAKGRPEGRTVLYDAIAKGLHYLDTGRNDKKTLVLVTDGGDNRSRISLDTIMRKIEESHTTIYTVGLYDSDDIYSNPGVLRRIANVSGGECFLPKRSEEIKPICEKIARDIRSRYTIGYIPNQSNGAPGVRKISVKATSPEYSHLIVKSRTSYRMPGPSAK